MLFFRDIWNRFLEFESNIGDLQSIVKVEKRRSEVLSKIKEFEGKETAQLVDRYRFLDLFPCTPQELKSIGYTEVINITGAAGKNHILQSIIEFEPDLPLPVPDYSQMIPYKPKAKALPGEHPVPG
uniref:Protein suppressor of forked-like n=1 Tax=Diabrotica virgifera virgifera TaxID=50390 RepID=A0A6P7F2J3_DIAVI